MKNLLRIILSLLLTPAYLIADENANAKDENDNPVVEEEAKENDETEVEEEIEDGSDNLVVFPLTASDIANALAWFWSSSIARSIRK